MERARVLRLAVAALAIVTAGYMLVDGARALVVGDYFTIDGELGPWAALVEAFGVDPRSSAMKGVFVAYGALWLVATGLFLARRAPAGVMLAFALASLWYAVIGTAFSLAQAALLVLARRRLAD